MHVQDVRSICDVTEETARIEAEGGRVAVAIPKTLKPSGENPGEFVVTSWTFVAQTAAERFADLPNEIGMCD